MKVLKFCAVEGWKSLTGRIVYKIQQCGLKDEMKILYTKERRLSGLVTPAFYNTLPKEIFNRQEGEEEEVKVTVSL